MATFWKPALSRPPYRPHLSVHHARRRYDPRRPAWLTAVSPYSSNVGRCPRYRLEGPRSSWSVYSHRHRSAIIVRSVADAIRACLWAIPSLAHARPLRIFTGARRNQHRGDPQALDLLRFPGNAAQGMSAYTRHGPNPLGSAQALVHEKRIDKVPARQVVLSHHIPQGSCCPQSSPPICWIHRAHPPV